jgi:hypothetical protein
MVDTVSYVIDFGTAAFEEVVEVLMVPLVLLLVFWPEV